MHSVPPPDPFAVHTVPPPDPFSVHSVPPPDPFAQHPGGYQGPGSAAAEAYVKTYTSSYTAGGGGGPDETSMVLNTLTLYSLAGVDSDAVCNDGSPGGYYFAPGQPGTDLWVIYLQGGMWCWNEDSCTARYQETGFEMSSTGWKKTQEVGGIFSTEAANPWSKANRVYLEYVRAPRA